MKHVAKSFVPKWLNRLLGPLFWSLLCAFAIAFTWVFYLNYPESPDRIVAFPHVEKRVSAFAPDGKTTELISIDDSPGFSRPRIVNADTGQTIIEPTRLHRSLENNTRISDPQIARHMLDYIKPSHFDPTGKRYCIVANQIEVVDLPLGRTCLVHPPPSDDVLGTTPIWSNDGSTFAVVETSKPSKVTVYDVASGNVRQKLTGYRVPCDLSRNGELLLVKSADSDNACEIIEVATGHALHRISGPPNTVLQFAKAGIFSDIAALGFGAEPMDDPNAKCDVQIVSLKDASLISAFQSRPSNNLWTLFQMNDQFLSVGGQCFDLNRKPITYIDDLLGGANYVFADKINRLITSRSQQTGHGDWAIRNPQTLERLQEGVAWSFQSISDDGRYLIRQDRELLTANLLTRYVSQTAYRSNLLEIIDTSSGQPIRLVPMREDFDSRFLNHLIFRPSHDEVWIANARKGPSNLEYHVFEIRTRSTSTFWPWLVTGVLVFGLLLLLATRLFVQRHPATPSLT